jgi:glycosyltransferase involved in cell wall biosynthesis
LLGALDRGKHEPVLVCPRDGQLPAAVGALGMEARILPYRGASVWFVPSVWARFPESRRIETVLGELSPQVVHSDFHTLPYALPACRRLGVPLIFTCYGWWFRPRPWQRGFYRNGPRAILAISEAVRRGFLGDPPFMPPERVRVLHLGVDTALFRPRPAERAEVRSALELSPESPLVTLLGRYQSVKGQDVFLESCTRIASRRPEARFIVAGENIFGGTGDEVFKRRIYKQAQAEPLLRDRVRFLGWVPDPERLLAASDVVVCASRFESFGMVLVEAMASGVPAVSTNVGGPAETIVDGETGYLVPPGRPDLIAARVLDLLADADLRRRMGTAGRARVQERFALRRYVEGFSEVMETLAEKAEPPGG